MCRKHRKGNEDKVKIKKGGRGGGGGRGVGVPREEVELGVYGMEGGTVGGLGGRVLTCAFGFGGGHMVVGSPHKGLIGNKENEGQSKKGAS